MADVAEAPAAAPPRKKKPSLGKQVTTGLSRTVGAGKTVLSTMERGVKKTYDALLKENLKASSPMTSSLWYLLKHPLVRSLTTIVVLFLNLFVYYGDPATFSNSESYGTMIGDIWHGWFEPEQIGWFLLRWLAMICLGLLGLFVGIKLQHWLRDTWHLALFGYDSGENEKREPLASQDGALFLVICSTCMSWWIGLKIYNRCMPPNHKVGSGMHKWDYAFFNLMLAGLFTFSSDVWNVVTVVDQMAQSIEHETSGVSAEAVGMLYAPKGSRLERCAAWFVKHRLTLTRVGLLSGWCLGGGIMIWRYEVTKEVLYDTSGTKHEVGRSPFWTKEGNTEFMRHFVACVVRARRPTIAATRLPPPPSHAGRLPQRAHSDAGLGLPRLLGGRDQDLGARHQSLEVRALFRMVKETFTTYLCKWQVGQLPGRAHGHGFRLGLLVHDDFTF